jgi:hypothetical protein
VEFWLYKERDQRDSHNQTFVVSEVAHWDLNQSIQKSKYLAIHETNVKGMYGIKSVTTLYGFGLLVCDTMYFCGTTLQTVQHHKPKDQNLNLHNRENPKFHYCMGFLTDVFQ